MYHCEVVFQQVHNVLVYNHKVFEELVSHLLSIEQYRQVRAENAKECYAFTVK